MAPATTDRPRAATPLAANSKTSSAPARSPATPPAAAPKPSTATSTTPHPGPTARPTSATSARNADATIAPSKPPAGTSSNPSQASPAGPSPTAAATPPNPPRTTADIHSSQAPGMKPASVRPLSAPLGRSQPGPAAKPAPRRAEDLVPLLDGKRAQQRKTQPFKEQGTPFLVGPQQPGAPGCTRPRWTPATEPVIWLTGARRRGGRGRRPGSPGGPRRRGPSRPVG